MNGRNTNADAFTDKKRAVGWTVVEGRMPARSGEVLLGARLSRELGRSIDDHVTLRAARQVRRLDVVGVGVGPSLNNQQFGGDVVIVPHDLESVARTTPFEGASITFAAGVDGDALARKLGAEVEIDRAERPPDVDNLAQLDVLPELLAAFLVVLGVAIPAHLLVTMTRRRRRDLDTLRAIGWVPRQVEAAVLVAALVITGVGLVLGVPLGIAAGRIGWRFTARAVYVAGDPSVPVLALIAFVAGRARRHHGGCGVAGLASGSRAGYRRTARRVSETMVTRKPFPGLTSAPFL